MLRDVGGVFLEVARFRVGAARCFGVAGGDGVRGEQDVDGRVRGAGRGQLGADVGEAGGGAFNERLDETGVVEVLADLIDFEPSGEAGFGQRDADVFAVLAAAGVAGVGAGGDHQDLAVPGVVDLLEGLRDVGGPVPVAPEDGQVDAAGGEFGLDAGLEFAVLGVDGADAAVGAVVVRDLFEALVRDAAAAGDVAQERKDVILAFRAAEGGEQHGVIGLRGHSAGFGHLVDGGVGCDGVLGIQRAHERTSAISAALTRRPV